MGVRVPPGFSGVDPKLVEQLIEVEKVPIEQAKERRQKIVEERDELKKLQGMLGELGTAANGFKTKQDFYKLMVESSHPDIIDGVVDSYALPGSYEFEVRGVARTEKELAYGFPDKDQTPVGFGYMMIEREDGEPAEVVVDPGSTLGDVATKINDAELGVKAMVINTKYKPDSYRLLVISEESGKEAKISLDEDTTFLEFKEQVTGRNLDVLFEDVPVTDQDNTLEELVDGVVFNIKRSEPGTRIQVGIVHDVDTTLEGIKAFVEKYNEIATFVNSQFKDPREGDPGKLSGDSSIKTILRNLRSAVYGTQTGGGKFRNLADIGITTDAKTGNLNFDETKVRQALSEDYDGVARLFIRSRNFEGLGERVSQKVRGFEDIGGGVMRSRLKGLDSIIDNQDRDIERLERRFTQREEGIRRKFTNLETRMAGLKAQGSFLQQRFGGASSGQTQGGGGQ